MSSEGEIFNLRRLQAKSKVMLSVIRELLFADDCAIMAHTIELLTDCFAKAAKRFGLKINLKKTEVLFQSTSFPVFYKPTVTIDNTPLNVVDKFCYLSSVLSRNADISDDIERRIGAACAAFGKLEARLWKSRDLKLTTKVHFSRPWSCQLCYMAVSRGHCIDATFMASSSSIYAASNT